MKLYRRKKAFTLIELLMVLSIIALLTSIVISSLSTSKQKARDTERIQEMRQVQIALELYRSQNDNFPTASGLISTSLSSFLVTGGYIPSLPIDPYNSGTTQYYYCNSAVTSVNCNAQVEGDSSDLSSYAMRFETEYASALGGAGFYCVTAAGIHPESIEPDTTLIPPSGSDVGNRCEQTRP